MAIKFIEITYEKLNNNKTNNARVEIAVDSAADLVTSHKGINFTQGSIAWDIRTDDFYGLNSNGEWLKQGGGGGSATLIEKTITANSTYNASDDGADGYSKVVVDVTPPSNEFYPTMRTQALMAQNDTGSTWSAKTWNGLTSFNGQYVWTDGDNIYYSYDSDQYILDKSTSTWSTKTWSGLTSFSSEDIWTDGENIYYSYDSDHYILDKSTSTWSAKTWNGVTSFYGGYIWTDGDNIYLAKGAGPSSVNHYVLNKSTSTWSVKTWNGFTNFYPDEIWADGKNIYISNGEGGQYILNKSTSTWSAKTWSGYAYISADGIWTDGENIYNTSSGSSDDYILDKSTSTWSAKTWTGMPSGVDGRDIWTDGDNIYLSSNSSQYYLHITKKPFPRTAVKPE